MFFWPYLSAVIRRNRARILLLCAVALLFWLSGSTGGGAGSRAGAGGRRGPLQIADGAHRDDDYNPEFDGNGDLRPLSCKINPQVMANVEWTGEKAEVLHCMESPRDGEVYVPFTFVKKYFDIYGELKHSDNKTYLDWAHSYSRVFPHFGRRRYFFNGTFLNFGDFDVEMRSRVKCVTASEGVPISTQWDKAGYYYSTQISQFALSHWSKAVRLREWEEEEKDSFDSFLEDSEKVNRRRRRKKNLGGSARLVLEDGADHQGDWRGDVTRVTSLGCVHFDSASPILLDLDHLVAPSSESKREGKPQHPDSSPPRGVLSWSLQYKQDAVVSVTVRSPSLTYVLKYVPEDFHVTREGNVVSYGYGDGLREGEWKHFSRDLTRDLQKGVAKKAFQAFRRGGPARVVELRLEGIGCVTNVTLAEQEHARMFFSAADWLVKSQDSQGGWPVGIVFNKGRTKYPGADEVSSGWRSAMASGHALSVLSRAYSASLRREYLERAFRALELFTVPSGEGGFQAKLLDTHIWYEEYPTSPPTFVLNGFMYSLLGLYDLRDALETHELTGYDQYRHASTLFSSGMSSLLALLPLYDTGSGTVYDLRHFTGAGAGADAASAASAPPKLARWDYHAVHTNLLYVLSTVASSQGEREFLAATAERWRGYMMGKRAEHN